MFSRGVSMNRDYTDFAKDMLTSRIVTFEERPFKHHEKHPDRPLSPIQFNFRTPENPKPGRMTADLLSRLGFLLYLMSGHHDIQIDRVCGFPRTGEEILRHALRFIRVPLERMITLEKEDFADGKRRITGIKEGDFKAGMKVCVFDDVWTRGFTKDEGICVLEDAGLHVTDIVVAVDYEIGTQLPHLGIKPPDSLAVGKRRLHSLYTVEQLMGFWTISGVHGGWIKEDEFLRVKDWLKYERTHPA